jgi:DNA-binding SARP family transcriptional activator
MSCWPTSSPAGHGAERAELLDVLFDGRADDSTRAYLRQAVRWLRTVLPVDGVITEGAAIALSDQIAVVSESVELERALAQAARARGADRLVATLAALEIFDQGSYLRGIGSPWVEERREHLQELATDARYEAAELAFSDGRLQDAEQLTEIVLEAEPFYEAAWRLAMRLAGARGDHQAVLRSYQRCPRCWLRSAPSRARPPASWSTSYAANHAGTRLSWERETSARAAPQHCTAGPVLRARASSTRPGAQGRVTRSGTARSGAQPGPN